MAIDFVKNGKLRTFVALAFRNGMAWHHVYAWLHIASNATILCKILVKISPVVSAEDSLMEIALRVHVVVWRISSDISGCTGLIFAIFSPYEGALHADDGSVPYFPICQGTFPWQPNNEGKLILCALFARLLDGSTVSFCYYLLGGDTVALSGLLDRLCYAFLFSSLFYSV